MADADLAAEVLRDLTGFDVTGLVGVVRALVRLVAMGVARTSAFDADEHDASDRCSYTFKINFGLAGIVIVVLVCSW